MFKFIGAVFACVVFVFAMGFGMNKAIGASYDIKEIAEPEFVLAERVSIGSEKVMNDITDLEISTNAGGTTQRFIFQCDKTTESMNIFYNMKDSTGYKARGATAMAITVYRGDETNYKQNGIGSVYQTEVTGGNFLVAMQSAANAAGKGAIVFEFYELLTDGTRSTIAYSQAIKTAEFVRMVNAIEKVQGSEVCNIESGFAHLATLK